MANDKSWSFTFESHVAEALAAKATAAVRALEKMGGTAETYAKKKLPG